MCGCCRCGGTTRQCASITPRRSSLSLAPLLLPSYLDVQCYEMCDAGAVIHSHGMETAMVTMIKPGAKEFRVSGKEALSVPQYQLQ